MNALLRCSNGFKGQSSASLQCLALLTRIRSARDRDRGSIELVHCRQFTTEETSDLQKTRAGKLAVIGGGPSGLSCAYYLKKRAAELGLKSVTLFEGSNRVGGWVQTKLCSSNEVDSESFLFDSGPRSLRGSTESALYTLRLIEELGLQKELISGSKASGRRIIYVNNKLQELSPLSPLGLKVVIPAVLSEAFKSRRTSDEEDESIHSFFARRFSKEMADVLASAMTLGIFGGNAKTLSIRTCFPALYDIEQEHRSVLVGMIRTSLAKRKKKDYNNDSEFVRSSSKLPIFSFKNGLETLTKSIASTFNNHQEYRIQLSHTAIEMTPNKEKKGIKLTFSERETGSVKSEDYDHVISTVPAKQLGEMLKKSSAASSSIIQDHTSTVSLAVVNMGWSDSWRNWPEVAANLPGGKEGGAFGYLVPPKEKQPILGTVFDSETFPQQSLTNKYQTRLTVMLGGTTDVHENVVNVLDYDNNPTKLAEIALRTLEQHVKAKLPPPKLAQASVCREAIPQYPVGYYKILAKLDKQLATDFGESLSVIGNSFGGIGVNDCIASGYRVVERLVARHEQKTPGEGGHQRRVLLDLA